MYPTREADRRRRRAGAAWWAALALVACAGSSNRTAGDPEAYHALLVLPLNVVTAMPGELEEGAAQVDAALRGYLQGYGKSVETIPLSEARAEWVASAADLRAEVGPDAMTFEGAARHLARRLRAKHAYDALVVPGLAMRPARLRSRRVSWDGVDRKLETVGEPREHGSVTLANTFHGEIQAPSLAVYVFSPDGALLFQGIGGLDLAHRAHVYPGKYLGDTKWDMELRPELFTDPALLREGVEVAFDPFLPRRRAGE